VISSNIGPIPFSNGAGYRNQQIDQLFNAAGLVVAVLVEPNRGPRPCSSRQPQEKKPMLPKVFRWPLDEVGGEGMLQRIRHKLRELSRQPNDGLESAVAALEGFAAAVVVLALAVCLGLFD